MEAKALKQLANLANIRHPAGGHVCKCCATPDFHPGDAGVAIGSIVETAGMLIPAVFGSDINCGMRSHVVDLSLEQSLTKRDRFVELMKGDYFFGTRDVTMTAKTAQALFQHGIPGWLDAMLDSPTGSIVKSDLRQLASEIDRVYLEGASPAHSGQPLIIPGSMGAASYLLIGKGNPHFLSSASHGAGRKRSRFELSRRGAAHSEEALGLTGVDCITLRQERRIEEAPAAYKPIEPVIDIQVEAKMVSIVARMTPVITFKA